MMNDAHRQKERDRMKEREVDECVLAGSQSELIRIILLQAAITVQDTPVSCTLQVNIPK